MYLEEMPGPFSSLYVGGGTPTLCLTEMEDLLTRLPVYGERAIEVLPGHMTPETCRRRPDTADANRSAIETATGTFDCIDVDLVFDTAFDDPETLLDDLTICFEYRVEQVSTYPLMRFGYTPFGKGRHHGRLEHQLLACATQLAESSGYERRSVWTFNRIGSPAYTSITRPYFLGLGAGSASFTGELFFVNHFGVDPYGRALDEGSLPVARIARLSMAAAALYRSFWQAYTGTIPRRSGDPLLNHPLSVVARITTQALGWSKQAGESLILTPTGYDRYNDLERWVTYHLIEPLWAEMMSEHRSSSAAPSHVGPM